MQTLWSSDHLFFMYEPGADTVYNIHQPWISCILSETVPSMKPLESPDVIHSFPVILSFAKLLLELETGEELKAIKSGRSQKPSLLAALWEYCRTWSHRQLDEHYAEALEACVNFPKYFRIQQQEDLTTTVHDVILNRIVRPLEKRLDISQLGEWGKRNIDLRARVPITDPTGQIAFEGVSNNAECQVHEGRPRQAKQRPNVASSTVGSHGNKPRGIHGFARKQAQSTSQHKLGSEIPKKLDARLASGTQSFSPQTPSKVYVPSQTRSANNARRGLPVRVVENSSSRTSADSISKAIPATKKTHLTQKEDTYASAIKKFRSKTDVSSQPSSPSRTGPRNRRHSPKQNPNAPLSGFGKCLSHDLKA